MPPRPGSQCGPAKGAWQGTHTRIYARAQVPELEPGRVHTHAYTRARRYQSSRREPTPTLFVPAWLARLHGPPASRPGLGSTPPLGDARRATLRTMCSPAVPGTFRATRATHQATLHTMCSPAVPGTLRATRVTRSHRVGKASTWNALGSGRHRPWVLRVHGCSPAWEAGTLIGSLMGMSRRAHPIT